MPGTSRRLQSLPRRIPPACAAVVLVDADLNCSERYEEATGSADVNPYTVTAALMVPCVTCGADVGVRCAAPPTIFRSNVGRRYRRIPCLTRMKAAEAQQ